MRLSRIVVGLSVLCLLGLTWTAESCAQGGVTIQLPTIGFFNVNTVVSVPDGGRTSLGGVRRGAWGRTSRSVPLAGNIPGLGRGFNNTAIGRDASASNASVSAKIIVMSELEQEVLAEAERRRALRSFQNPNGTASTQRKADFITRNIGRNRRR